jgi:hypothetical protein
MKQLGDRLAAEKAERDRTAGEEAARMEADQRKRAAIASEEAQAWLNEAKELIPAAGRRVPVFLRHEVPDGPGFELTVGETHFSAILRPEGWRVTQVTHDLHSITGLPTNLSELRPRIVEQMVAQGLRDLFDGRVAWSRVKPRQ